MRTRSFAHGGERRYNRTRVQRANATPNRLMGHSHGHCNRR